MSGTSFGTVVSDERACSDRQADAWDWTSGTRAPTHARLAKARIVESRCPAGPDEREGVAWMTMFDAALAAHARFWGASGNLIFPLTVGLGEQEVFWALADRFDADAFVT
jgi:hypothetical protein